MSKGRGTRWAGLSEVWWALPKLGRAGQGRAVGILSIWILWDHVLESIWRMRLVRAGGILRYRMAHHWGPPVTLKDGTVVTRGSRVVELHFDNAGLMQMAPTEGWNPWEFLENIDRDFDELRSLLAAGRLGPARALHAVTLYFAPARRFGFEIHRVPHTWAWSLQRYFLIGLVPIYHRDGWREFDRMRRDRWPAEIWMSADQLLDRTTLKARE